MLKLKVLKTPFNDHLTEQATSAEATHHPHSSQEGILLRLSHRLNSVESAQEAGIAIAHAADLLFGWDAAFINLYSEKTGMGLPLIEYDLVEGDRRRLFPRKKEIKLSETQTKVLEEGARLLLFDGEQGPHAGILRSFGDREKRSTSLMFVPIRRPNKNIGILSVQSYSSQAYDQQSIVDLQFLADYSSAALERVLTEEQIKISQKRISVVASLANELLTISSTDQVLEFLLMSLERAYRCNSIIEGRLDRVRSSLNVLRVLSEGQIESPEGATIFLEGQLFQAALHRNKVHSFSFNQVSSNDWIDKESSHAIVLPLSEEDGHDHLVVLFFDYRFLIDGELLDSISPFRELTISALKRIHAEESLRRTNEELEDRVRERTSQLEKTNASLLQEISRREQIEEELAFSHETYRNAIENAGGIPYRIDFRKKRYDFIGEHIKDLLGIEIDKASPELIGAMTKRIEVTGEGKMEPFNVHRQNFRAGHIDKYHADLLLALPDKRERWFMDCAVPIRDEKGIVTGAVGILQDITERKEEEQRSLLAHEQEVEGLRQENILLRKHIKSGDINNPTAFESIVTRSTSMNLIFRYLESAAPSKMPVLITGETGTGKELLAPIVHKLSERAGEFVSINIAGLDDHIFSDTLFGHTKGAFTGAIDEREGLIERAKDGTIFLDEVGDLDLKSQVKLLRLLQSGEYYRLGSDDIYKSNARVVAATNKDLHQLISRGEFRKDLYYRLQGHHVSLPPLRDRLEDLPLLVDHFLEQASKSLGKPRPQVPKELYILLRNHLFPGNIRELEGMIYDALSRHRGKVLSLDVFKKRISSEGSEMDPEWEWVGYENKPVRFSYRLPKLDEITDLLVEEALDRCDHNQSMAARLIGITQQSMNRRVRMMRENRR